MLYSNEKERMTFTHKIIKFKDIVLSERMTYLYSFKRDKTNV